MICWITAVMDGQGLQVGECLCQVGQVINMLVRRVFGNSRSIRELARSERASDEGNGNIRLFQV
jgi:hypothetical protein